MPGLLAALALSACGPADDAGDESGGGQQGAEQADGRDSRTTEVHDTDLDGSDDVDGANDVDGDGEPADGDADIGTFTSLDELAAALDLTPGQLTAVLAGEDPGLDSGQVLLALGTIALAGLPVEAGGELAAALTHIPRRTDEPITISGVSWTRLREEAGLEHVRVPDGDLDRDRAEALLQAMGQTAAVGEWNRLVLPDPLNRSSEMLGDVEAAVGIPLPNIDSLVATGSTPAEGAVVVTGSIDPDAVAASQQARPEWEGAVTVAQMPNGVDIQMGEGGAVDQARRDAVDPLGRGRRLLVTDSAMVVAIDGSRAEAMSVLDDDPTMLDMPSVGVMVTHLDNLGVSAFRLTDRPNTDVSADWMLRGLDGPPDDEERAALQEVLDSLVGQHLVRAGAQSALGGVEHQHLAFAFILEEQATEAAERLPDRLATVPTGRDGPMFAEVMDDVSIEVDGPMVTVTFTSDDPFLWTRLLDSHVTASM